MAMARKLKEKEEARRKAELDAAEIQQKDILASKERTDRERQAKLEAEKWADYEAAEEAKRQEELRIWKTKEYFEFNKFGRKKDPEGYPSYFGYHVGKNGAWRPEGEGAMYYEGKKVFEGHYLNGLEHGDGWQGKWKGGFQTGRVHGVGEYDGKEALVRKNIVLCLKEELINGKCIQFNDPSMRQYNKDRQPQATILYHIDNWRYKMRFHDDSDPLVREVDFRTIKDFKILHTKPLIYPLAHFKIDTDSTTRYKYWEDVYGQKERPRLGAVGGRRATDCSAHGVKTLSNAQRFTSDYRENVMEPRAAGIGEAMELEDVEFQKELKRKQWAKLIDERRAKEEEEKKKEVEAEEKRQMAANLAKQKEKVAKEAEESKKMEAEMQSQLDQFEAEYTDPSAVSPKQEK